MKNKKSHTVGECMKPREQKFANLNIHDPDNKYIWAKDVPKRDYIYLSIGFVCLGIVTVGCMYLLTVLIFLMS